MSKRFLSILQFTFLIFAFLSFASSQLIATSSPYLFVAENKLNDIRNFFQLQFADSLNNIQFSDIMHLPTMTVIKNITIKKANYNTNGSLFVNLSKETSINGKNNFEIVFQGTYSINKGEEKLFDFSVSNADMSGIFGWDRVNKVPIVQIETDCTKAVIDCEKIAEVDRKLVCETLINAFGANMAMIGNAIADGIKNFYVKKYMTFKPITFNTAEIFNKIPITLNFKEFPGFCMDEGDQNVTGICYFSGNIDDPVFNISKEALAYDKFAGNSEYSKVFIHNSLFNQIFSKILAQKTLTFDLNDNSRPSKLDYRLNVQYLSTIFPDLVNYLSRESPILVSNEITSIKMQPEGLGIFEMTSSISVNEGKIIDVVKFRSMVMFTLGGKIEEGNKFNLCLDSVTGCKITKIETPIRVGNLDQLEKWIPSSFNYLLKEKQFCMANESLLLDVFFKYIESFVHTKNGVYIQGKWLYQ